MEKKNIILDSQVLSTLMSCARLTDLRFNLDLQSLDGKSSSLEMGSIVHAILEHFAKAMINGANRKDAVEIGYAAGAEYIQGYSETNKYIRDESEIGCHNTTAEDLQLVNDTMAQYFDYYKNDSWVPISAEHVKQVILYEDDEVRILWKAKLDLEVDTNNGIYPVDHKTMKQRRDSFSLNNQFMGQCIVTKSRGVIIDKIGFQKSLKVHEKFTRPIISYSLARLVEWSQSIVPFYAKQYLAYAEIGYWPPNFTHCENKYGFCPMKQICESDPSMREEVIRLNYRKAKKWDVTND